MIESVVPEIKEIKKIWLTPHFTGLVGPNCDRETFSNCADKPVSSIVMLLIKTIEEKQYASINKNRIRNDIWIY